MTILQLLNAYYDCMAARGEAVAPGWGVEKFGWCIVLDTKGRVVAVEDLRDTSGKKPIMRRMVVPASFDRAGITPKSFFLWDNSKFVLGVTKAEKVGSGEAQPKWVVSEKSHDAFKSLHRERLKDAEDFGLRALLAFLDLWTPNQFSAEGSRFTPEMIDANFMFRLDSDEGGLRYLRSRPSRWCNFGCGRGPSSGGFGGDV